MHVLSKSTLKFFLVPGGIVLPAAILMAHSGWVAFSPPALTFLYYCAVLGGMLLAWRFHSSRTVLALLVLFLAGQTIAVSGAFLKSMSAPAWSALQAVAVLVPVNFVLIATIDERGFSVPNVAPVGLVLFVEIVILSVLMRSAEGLSPNSHPPHVINPTLPGYATWVFCIALVALLTRALFTRKPLDCALAWSLVLFQLAIHFRTPQASAIYEIAAACNVGISVIENSYLLAFHDELTSLPSRRAFNDAMARLQAPYSIAVVDIDHFKRFNDTHGHETGDQVLRLVASNLSRVTGGGRAYRCGGEEFAILFPGKELDEVTSHLEQLRAGIETTEFRLRGEDRRQVERGPERRNERTRARTQKGHVIRKLSQPAQPLSLSVTVSIGVGAGTSKKASPANVLQAADEALYRAKDNGRNRVETATAGKRRKSKAAGIA